MTLEQRAASIPHMGAKNIGAHLSGWAAGCKSNIVECGSWLGSGTAYLAIGAKQSGAKLHIFDKWRANDDEVRKAEKFGFALLSGQDTLPLVRKMLEPFGVDITFTQGQILDATWDGDPIGLFVLDAAKRNPHFRHVAETFFPFLEDGALVVLMDFHHYQRGGDRYLDQVNYMAKHPEFEKLEDQIGEETSAALFRYRRN